MELLAQGLAEGGVSAEVFRPNSMPGVFMGRSL